MKKILKRKSVPVEPQVEPNVVALIDKMQQQLIILEKKIDTLISQPLERSSGRSDYSKPFQRFDNSQHFGRGSQHNNYRERSFTKAICADCKAECEVPFRPTGDRPVYCKECFTKRKEGSGSFKARLEHNPRGGDFAKDRNFDKPQGRENHRPSGRKKPSLRRRKGRD
jgi:CxxC-x17-CxxC domain-containing protein